MCKRLLILVAALCIAAVAGLSPASAQAADWRLTARTGFVRVVQPNQLAHDGQLNEVIQPGSIISTGASSSATIENGAQRMVMTASSRMTIAAMTNNGMTRIIQDLGAVLFRVDHQDAQHFRVETPLLAATVKGTEFRVTVRPMLDSVAVTTGIVEVQANDGHARQDVRRGAAVHIAGSAPAQIAAGIGEQLQSLNVSNTNVTAIDSGGLRGHADAAVATPSDTGGAPVQGSASIGEMPKMPTPSGPINGTFIIFVALYLVGAFAIGILFYIGVHIVTGRSRTNKLMNKVLTPAERERMAQPPPPPPPETIDTKKQSSLRAFVQNRASQRKT